MTLTIPHPPSPWLPWPNLYRSRLGGSRSHRHEGLVDHLKGQRLGGTLRLWQHQGQGAAQLTQHLADARETTHVLDDVAWIGIGMVKIWGENDKMVENR